MATGGNPAAIQAGIDTRKLIVELVTADVDNGGDGMTRAALAGELGISKNRVHTHVTTLIEEGAVEQLGVKITPSGIGHIHVCRTCGQTMHVHGEGSKG
ncbi:winged helix-turn-helix transcriptional regulator [Nocardioides sp. 616]|uniref:winged helix-turn-helix domain-containing protein n=1 Tax=Nocardioides sp. 616 TaxID=2268090 RepID=UPI000CE510F3|nr:winged helix-turn-helix transcriptional regulator [Nocardioides sp. 616]